MELQAKDLRVGNWVDKHGEQYQAGAATIVMLERGESEVEPIPLTEEWLRRGGFEYDEYNFMGFVLESNLGISIGKDENGVWFYFGNLEEYLVDILNEIKYVHQLQNLYFALTGEELEFNQTPTTSWDH